MTTLAIKDLNTLRDLDMRTMGRIRGGGGAWVFGWIQPYVRPVNSPGAAVINFYEINNSFYADQMNNQFQNIDVRNSAPNSNISVRVDQGARNDGRLI